MTRMKEKIQKLEEENKQLKQALRRTIDAIDQKHHLEGETASTVSDTSTLSSTGVSFQKATSEGESANGSEAGAIDEISNLEVRFLARKHKKSIDTIAKEN
eukprot:140355_1